MVNEKDLKSLGAQGKGGENHHNNHLDVHNNKRMSSNSEVTDDSYDSSGSENESGDFSSTNTSPRLDEVQEKGTGACLLSLDDVERQLQPDIPQTPQSPSSESLNGSVTRPGSVSETTAPPVEGLGEKPATTTETAETTTTTTKEPETNAPKEPGAEEPETKELETKEPETKESEAKEPETKELETRETPEGVATTESETIEKNGEKNVSGNGEVDDALPSLNLKKDKSKSSKGSSKKDKKAFLFRKKDKEGRKGKDKDKDKVRDKDKDKTKRKGGRKTKRDTSTPPSEADTTSEDTSEASTTASAAGLEKDKTASDASGTPQVAEKEHPFTTASEDAAGDANAKETTPHVLASASFPADSSSSSTSSKKGKSDKDKDKSKKAKKASKKSKGKEAPGATSLSSPTLSTTYSQPPPSSSSTSSTSSQPTTQGKGAIFVGAHGPEGRKESKEHKKLRILSTMELDHSKSNLVKIPDDLHKYTNLKVLNLSYNRLSSLPSSFGLPALTTLLLSHNQLSDLSPKLISHMPRLVLVDLSHNAFEALPKEFSSLKDLKSLQLDHNKLTALFDFSKLKNLERLSAEDNKIKHLAKVYNIHTAISLTSLNLSHNQLEVIPQLPPSLHELLLHNNLLSDLPADSLAACTTSLRRLTLGGNQFSKFPASLYTLSSLEHLFIENNRLEEIGVSPLSGLGINKMIGLRQLDLSRNALKSMPSILGQLTNLERLHLNENKLTSLPPELKSLTRLTYLDVEDNPGFDESTMPQVRTKADIAAAAAVSSNRGRETAIDVAAAVAEAIALAAANQAPRDARSDLNPLLAPLNVPKDEPFDFKLYIDKENLDLFKDLGASADMNRSGLARGKKDQLKRRNRQILHKMEDDMCIYAPLKEDRNKALLCLFDGHAGPETANVATSLFPQELGQRLKDLDPNCTDMKGILTETFLAVDEFLKEEHQCVGATATVVMIWRVGEDRYLQSANLGDSFAFLCRGGEPIQLVQEHKLSVPSEFARILESGVQLAPGQTRINGLAVTRALGDHFAKENGSGMIAEPHVSPVYKLQPEDKYLLLASDGLWDSISGRQALDMITSEKMVSATAQQQADMLMKACLGHETCQDNVALVVVHL